MKATNRPQTAPSAKPQRIRSAQTSRPLGRFSHQPLREVANAHGANDANVLSSIKGDIVTLQHLRERLANPDGGALPSMAMQTLEQQLAAFGVVVGDATQTADNRSHLLEMLVQVVRSASGEALHLLDMGDDAASFSGGAVTAASVHPPSSRISGFVDLLDKVLVIAERKKMWSGMAERDHQENAEGTQCDTPSSQQPHNLAPIGRVATDDLDSALNEPTVSQLRTLISQQRKLQQRLSEVVPATPIISAPKVVSTSKPSTPKPAVAAREKETQSHGGKHVNTAAAAAANNKASPEEEQLKHNLEKATAESNILKSRILELELEVRRFQEDSTKSVEDADDFNKVFCALAYKDVDTTFLTEKVKIDLNLQLPQPSEAESSVAARINAIISESHGSMSTPSRGETASSRKKDSGNSVDGSLWIAMKRQSSVIHSLTKYAMDLDQQVSSFTNTDSQEVQRLRKLVKAHEQKSRDQVNAASRDKSQRESELISAKKSIEQLEGSLRTLNNPTERKRLVNVKGQSITAAEREDGVRAELAHSDQCVKDLSDKVQKLKDQVQQEQISTSALLKERSQLLQSLAAEKQRGGEVSKVVVTKQSELTEAKDIVHVLRKDLREKAAVEADLQQQLWKMEVEMHISENVINDLRLREEDLTKRANDAQTCQQTLRDAIDKERKDSALKFSRLEEQLRVAKANERAAKENLRSERSRMLGNEKEVERLRALDTQMEMLENNFTNYAASKLAQRDAQEEDERQLEACVENLMRDVFELPLDQAAEDEVSMYLQRLKAQQGHLENEERLRRLKVNINTGQQSKSQERGAKKQLVNILQERYNLIQIFAAEQRIRQITSEKETSRTGSCYADLKSEHDRCLQDLSLSKVQCESLVQRNTELELERTQLLRNRASAEMEIKNLKATLQRLKMHGEEQEKILIEVGTQLQNAKLEKEGIREDGTVPPLGTAIVGEF